MKNFLYALIAGCLLFAAPAMAAPASNFNSQTALCDPTNGNGKNCAKPDSNGNLPVTGGVVDGTPKASQPYSPVACVSETAQTDGTDATINYLSCDTKGRRLRVVIATADPSNIVQGLTSAMTSTTSTAVTGVGAPASGLRNYITTLVCGNSHATQGTFVELQDGSSGTTFWTVPAGPGYGGGAFNFITPLKQPSTATALYVKDTTSGANVICSVVGFKGP